MSEVLWAQEGLCRKFCGPGGGVCRNYCGLRKGLPELLCAWGGYAGTFVGSGGCCCCCCCCEGTQHVPAGEIAGQAVPGQGAREQSAGVTLAGRVPTTTEGGGGVPPSIWGGGGGARRCERDHLSV